MEATPSTEVGRAIIEILREQPLSEDTLKMLEAPPEDFALDEVSLSSLEVIVLAMEIESRFDIEFETEELETLPRFSDLVARVSSLVAEKAS